MMEYYDSATNRACAAAQLTPQEEEAFRWAVLTEFHGNHIDSLTLSPDVVRLVLAAAGKIIRGIRRMSGARQTKVTLDAKYAFIKEVALYERMAAKNRILGRAGK